MLIGSKFLAILNVTRIAFLKITFFYTLFLIQKKEFNIVSIDSLNKFGTLKDRLSIAL